MKTVALIPARFASTRFPGKMLARLGGKTVIRYTYDAAINLGLFDAVYVVTDHQGIFDEIAGHGGNALMSVKAHETGTDRIAEAAENIPADIIFNIQGDEPFIKHEPVRQLIGAFADDRVDVATLVQRLHDEKEINDPNFVKVVKDVNDFVMYFSRSPIPYRRGDAEKPDYYEHIGVYAFRKQALLQFSRMPPTPNERAEKVEPIRFLENGMKIKVFTTDYMGIEIDTEADLIKANNFINQNG